MILVRLARPELIAIVLLRFPKHRDQRGFVRQQCQLADWEWKLQAGKDGIGLFWTVEKGHGNHTLVSLVRSSQHTCKCFILFHSVSPRRPGATWSVGRRADRRIRPCSLSLPGLRASSRCS